MCRAHTGHRAGATSLDGTRRHRLDVVVGERISKETDFKKCAVKVVAI